jgi:3-oxoacyl-[acyl-carrier protein] reductase
LDSDPGGVGLLGSVERCFELGGRYVAAVAVEALLVEPVHPRERRELELIDVLVNNVGDFLGISKPFVATGEEDWEALYRINLKHVFLCCQAFVPRMIEQGSGGSIVNVSTIEAFRGIPGCTVYSAFNAGITGFTKSLALELAPERIRVNAIAPETTETLQVRPSQWIPPAKREAVPYLIPLGRFGTPDDAAGCALFLASELSAWVTGTTVHLDGGALAAGGFYRVPGRGWTNTPVIKDAAIGGF